MFKIGDLVRVEGTHESRMPASMVGILVGRPNAYTNTGTIWNVRFTNGAILKIWQGHLINLAEDSNINLEETQNT
jgi:hypothetical protein